MVVIKAAVEHDGSFDRKHNSTFEIEESHEQRSVPNHSAHPTSSQSVAASIAITPNQLQKPEVDRITQSWYVISSPQFNSPTDPTCTQYEIIHISTDQWPQRWASHKPFHKIPFATVPPWSHRKSNEKNRDNHQFKLPFFDTYSKDNRTRYRRIFPKQVALFFSAESESSRIKNSKKYA